MMKRFVPFAAMILVVVQPSPSVAAERQVKPFTPAQMQALCGPELNAAVSAKLAETEEWAAIIRADPKGVSEYARQVTEDTIRDLRTNGAMSESFLGGDNSDFLSRFTRDDWESNLKSALNHPDDNKPVLNHFGQLRREESRTYHRFLACEARAYIAAWDAKPLPSSQASSPVPNSANPAVWSLDESLTPLSIGGSNAPAPPGKDAHIIASNGKSAMTCVKLVRIANGDSKLTGTGGRVLSNQCTDAVEAGWCYSPGDCDTEHGSSWTIRSGRSWPVQSAGTIRWAACHGANTQSFVKGSHGLRYYCTAPK